MKFRGILPLLFTVIGLASACKNKTSTTDSNPPKADRTEMDIVVADTVKPVPVESPVSDTSNESSSKVLDSIDFKKYQTEAPVSSGKAAIDWQSYPEAKTFKTRITEGYKNEAVDFAGHYVSVVFGCGAGCVLGFMVDVRDGKIYALPLGEENSCFFMEDAALMVPDSRLFISAVCKEAAESEKRYYKAYLWDEEQKSFGKIAESEFVKP
ncbi:hypothetical protein SAMN05421820_101735 [Pedobacter steynii]|uniref:Lipoprotein n=1 Tax=Pedobacter steynii TaxID=430522 RepID=A0A1G9L2F8_9SPHI|nr:hypothetical protein [Pedobacter steynii]NQX38704.1 hypothetical protein [Pedobacter steynii]SDL55943.1 hypothetical protein SAMN05421820_101735 [Pedobacter steynii]